MARYLLDTNTCIAVMRSHPIAVGRMAAVAPGDCAISTVTAYELYTGVEKCANPAQERSKVELLLTTVWEMPFEPDAANWERRIHEAIDKADRALTFLSAASTRKVGYFQKEI